MSRGRRAQPDALKALKGNPGKRRLVLDNAGKGGALSVPSIPPPEWLTEDREKTVFSRIVDDYLHRRIAKPADITGYARWAHYVHRWIACKEYLNGKNTFYLIESNHGKRYARLPMFKDQLDLERVLQALEDRLGLNPVARQNLLRGLSTMPAALGGLFGDEPTTPPDAPVAGETPAEEQPTPSPIGIGRLN